MKGMILLKKFFTLFLALTLILSVVPAVYAAEFSIDPLKYEEYMPGETVVITGTVNTYITVGLYYPEESGGILKYTNIYSPAELSDGIEIPLGSAGEASWPYGDWKIVVQHGDDREELFFTFAETVVHPEPEKPTKPHTSGDSTVTAISLSPSEITVEAGKTASVDIISSASSFSTECDNEKIVSASVSGKKLTVKGLKRGTSTVWVRVSGNYASLKVTVTAPVSEPTSEPETEPVSEPVTEPVSEPETEPETESVSFTDIENHWAKDSILYLASRDIVEGFGGGVFAPEDKVTRAQFVTMLKNAFGFTSDSSEEVFPDVKKDDWYFDAVMAAYSAGITNGSDGKFNPNALVTRQDMAVLAYRAAENAHLTLSPAESELFADDPAISDYAKEAVYSMRASGVINGMTDVTFEPLGSATRAQAAAIIAKLCQLTK